MKSRLVLSICISLGMPGCRSIPKATPEELTQRDRWAALVPPQDRQRIIEQAERHGDWGEKRKIHFEIEHFQRLVEKQHSHRTTQPADR